MSKINNNRRAVFDDPELAKYAGATTPDDQNEHDEGEYGNDKTGLSTSGSVSDDQETSTGVNAHGRASHHRDVKGDHLDLTSHPYLMKILQKQGDKQVLFADKVLKFTASGKMKRRVLLITDFAIYILDPDSNTLKRRIALAAVDRILLSELSDNFFAIIIPTEYDLLMASTLKTEIANVIVEAIKHSSNFELEVDFANSFEYNAAAELVKEVHFEAFEGGVRTRILRK